MYATKKVAENETVMLCNNTHCHLKPFIYVIYVITLINKLSML
jgi:NADH:ubiquinone oxidoreductase subunit E